MELIEELEATYVAAEDELVAYAVRLAAGGKVGQRTPEERGQLRRLSEAAQRAAEALARVRDA